MKKIKKITFFEQILVYILPLSNVKRVEERESEWVSEN